MNQARGAEEAGGETWDSEPPGKITAALNYHHRVLILMHWVSNAPLKNKALPSNVLTAPTKTSLIPCFENGQDRGRKIIEESVVADQKESLEPREQQE